MTRTLIVLLAALALAAPAAAGELDTLWTLAYGDTGQCIFFDVAEAFDGGYVVTGFKNDSCQEDPILFKYDVDGTLLWERKWYIVRNQRVHAIAALPDGGYGLAGITVTLEMLTCAWAAKVDAQGETLWTRRFSYGDSGAQGMNVAPAPDNGLLVVGHTSSATRANMYIIRLDSLGDTLWTRMWGGSNGEKAYDVTVTPAGDYLIVGYSESYGSNFSDAAAIWMDDSGNVTRERVFRNDSTNQRAIRVRRLSDGTYAVVGYLGTYANQQVYFLRFREDGDSIYATQFGGPGADYGNCLAECRNDYIIVGGRTDDQLHLWRVNRYGSVLEEAQYGGAELDLAWGMEFVSDQSLVVTGETRSFNPAAWQGYLIKTIPYGSFLPNGGFDRWTAQGRPYGWTVEDSSRVDVSESADTAWTPPAAARLTRVAGGVDIESGIHRYVRVTANEPYTLTLWTMLTTPDAVTGAAITWRAADSSALSTTGPGYADSASTGWQALSLTGEAPTGAAYADVAIRLKTSVGSATLYIDEIELRAGLTGVYEPSRLNQVARPLLPTFARNILVLPSAFSVLTSDFVLMDACGRRQMSLSLGPNDISHLSPGVYFIRAEGSRGRGSEGSGRKVVIQK